MAKFILEIENWTEYEAVKAFSSFDRAKRHGVEQFPQNNWRVVDKRKHKIAYEHDPFSFIEREASGELNRFAKTEQLRQHYAERRAEEIRRGQERERMAERRARQRQQQRTMDGERHDMLSEEWYDTIAMNNPVTEKVNWRKEGF